MATVLVVDDDALSRELVRTLLNYRGHLVREASDGASALALIGRQPPDAVFTDVLMPGLDGYELARALRSSPTTRHIPIVFSTAHYGPDEIRPLADAYDVRDVIFKPAHPSTVLATIDALPIPGHGSLLPVDRAAEVGRLTRAGIWQLDPVTGQVVVSPELRDLLRLPATRLSADDLRTRVHPDDVPGLARLARDVWCSGSPGTVELRMVDADGAVHELIVSCRRGHDDGSHAGESPDDGSRDDGSPRLWGAVQDVTAIRERERTGLRVQTDWFAVWRTIDAFHRAVLPVTLPIVAGAGLAAVYLPAPQRLDIGAAWYDAQAVHGGRILLSVGRVAGHDRHPAAVMGRVLAALRAYAHDDPDPARVLTRLNGLLVDTRHDDSFATAVVALFDPAGRRLRIANGGHPEPLLLAPDHTGGPVGPAGPALGVLADVDFPELDLELAPGSVFCAYTDGLVDRPDDPTVPGIRRLRQVAVRALGRLGADDPDRAPAATVLAENIVRDMLGTADPVDDVCLAVLRVDEA